MNQKLIFCITFLVIFCCDISISFAALENNVGDFDDINKTLTIYDNESTVMTVRLISAVPDIGTFTEIFEVSNFEAYIPDKDNDFKARTVSYAGSGVTDVEWFIEQNVSYVVNVTDYGIKQVEEVIFNNKTGKNETILVNRTVITGYHDETRYKDVWVDYQPYDKVMSKDQVQRIKVVYHKVPELGPFHIQTVPIFRGVECPELTWWSGSWDRRRAILVNNTVGDSVTDYQLISVNLSSFEINATSSRIINNISGLEESFWNEVVDASGNLEYVWCNFSDLPSGGWINSTYCVYYQSSSTVSSSSSITDTFIIGDDFEDGDYSQYTVQGGTVVETGGYLKQTTNGSTDNHVTKDIGITDYIIEVKLRPDSFGSDKRMGLTARWDGNQLGYSGVIQWDDVTKLNNLNENVAWGTPGSVGFTFTTAMWYNFRYDIYGDSQKVKAWVSGTSEPVNHQASSTFNTCTTETAVGMASGGSGGTTSSTMSFDDFRVRKYTVNEPEPWTVGAEEEYSAPTPTPTLAPSLSVTPAKYDELDLPLILYILIISMLYLLIVFRNGVATIELSLIYLIFAFFFILFQTVTMSVNYIYLTLFLLLFMISIAGITLEKRSW